MKHKALLIPADRTTPPSIVEVGDDLDTLAKLVHGEMYPTRSEISFSSFMDPGVQLCYDDLGLYRDRPQVNDRAMALWATLRQMTMADFATPLVGDFVVLGVEPEEGETVDVPPRIIALVLGNEKAVPDA